MHTRLALVFIISAALAACGGKTSTPAQSTPAPTEPTTTSAEPTGDQPPGACETAGGTCAETTCEARGKDAVSGTCYLNGEPQTNQYCCAP